MKDSIHKRLTDQIRKTMGRYEPAYEPGSWEEFQRLRRKRQQRQPLVWFRYTMAACLLLGVLGVPVWLYVGRPDSAELAVSSLKTASTPKSPKGDLDAAKSGSRKSPLGDLGVKPGSRTALGAESGNVSNSQNDFQLKNSKSIALTRSGKPLKPKNESTKTDFSQYSNQSPGIDQTNQPHELIPQSGLFERIKPRSIKMAQQPLRPLGLPLKLWTEQPAIAKIERSKTGQTPIWGVSLAPQSVYAAGSSASSAVGGGLFSEIPISRRFSLSTGLSMAQQKLGTAEPEVFVVSTIPQLVATRIRLTAVDLPVNIRFRPKKSADLGFYAEAGLSSVAFLNEHYAYTYQQQKEVTVVVMGTNGQEQTTTQFVTARETINQAAPAFQKIYWGRILNLSIGVERRIGTRFRLSAEPYLKYPIGPFTRENLLLGSGGVSLRLGFQSVR
ncbi:outer membrane beta-barrel protein [Larkinella punicea]|uniref:Outer membrane protein beta-barrel domain-containing protein n=1 Tax=Larkinella punicea TaxID=2315727 RepID=A0A368JIA7_9BACT|nr:outer membrane beta-barrel protein [Larkinella punicea]RCR66414.1 hypothetical protein DUE52_27305 [Larkinella punicea]